MFLRSSLFKNLQGTPKKKLKINSVFSGVSDRFSGKHHHHHRYTEFKFKKEPFAFFKMLPLSAILLNKPSQNEKKDMHQLDLSIEHFHAGNLDQFATLLAEAAENIPYLKKLILLIEAERFKEADKLALTLCEKNIIPAFHYYLLKGVFCLCLKEFDIAEECLNHAINVAPNDKLRTMAVVHYSRLSSIKLVNDSTLPNEKNDKDIYAKAFAELQNIFIGNSTKKRWHDLVYSDYLEIERLIKQYTQNRESNKNRVTIRIWERAHDKETGHVSLETNEHYISHWPNVALGKRTFLHDIIAYRKLPIRISLSSLDSEKINQAFDVYLKNNCQWHALSSFLGYSKWLAKPGLEHSQNCSSLTAALLKAGGMENLASMNTETMYDLAKPLAVGSVLFIFSVCCELKSEEKKYFAKSISYEAFIKAMCEKYSVPWVPASPSAKWDSWEAETYLRRQFPDLKEAHQEFKDSAGDMWHRTGVSAEWASIVYFVDFMLKGLKVLGYGTVTHPDHIKQWALRAQEKEKNLSISNNRLRM